MKRKVWEFCVLKRKLKNGSGVAARKPSLIILEEELLKLPLTLSVGKMEKFNYDKPFERGSLNILFRIHQTSQFVALNTREFLIILTSLSLLLF